MVELKFGVGITQSFAPGELIALAQLCESFGYDHLWYANHKLGRDHYVGLALISSHTQRIQVGTFIAEPYSYHPGMIAAAIGTIDELSEGRAMLMLGAGAANFTRLRLVRDNPVAALRDTITICRALLAGEDITYHGERFSIQNGKLDFKTRSTLPIYVAARGHRMLEMAGAHADGVMLASHASRAGLQHAMQIVDQGCRQAVRTIGELELFTRIDLSLDEDRTAARQMVRPAIASFLTASYPDRNFVAAAGLQVPSELEDICRQRDDDLAMTAGHLVPDEFIDAFTWAGTAAEVAHQVTAAVDLGISNLTFVPQPSSGQSVFRTIEQFATEVVPRVRALLRS